MSTKLLITNEIIIKYCIKYAILDVDSLPRFSIIAFKILCITIIIKTVIILDIPKY